MPLFTRFLILILFAFGCISLNAQNISIVYQTPDFLYVCGTDTMTVTINNNGGATATGLKPTLSLGTGIFYLPGTVSGATESNIGSLNAPIFAINDLPVGSSATFKVLIRADCSLIGGINSGQQFSNTIIANYNGGTQQVTTSSYIVETGLLVATGVTPANLAGEFGQTLMRTVSVRNTRLGPIKGLHFTDSHFPGIDVTVDGLTAIGGSPVQYDADVPNSFFTAFGDGDDLFEKDEVVTFTEKITITDCGTPSFTNISTIKINWGCNNAFCQGDTAQASVTILPSSLNPSISIFTDYTEANDICGNEPAVHEILVVNFGGAPANNITVEPIVRDTGFIGITYNSFEYNDGSGWQSITPVNGLPTLLEACDDTDHYLNVQVVIPVVPPNDTVRIRFSTITCLEPCQSRPQRLRLRFSYEKKCPTDAIVNGTGTFLPDFDTRIRTGVNYDIGECLNDGIEYPFRYWAKTSRLLANDGYVRVQFVFPWGVFWQPNCVPILDGKSPVLIDVDTVPGVSTTLNLSYELPFSADTIWGDFCLKYFCDSSVNCVQVIPNPPPRGEDYTIFPPGTMCDNCPLVVGMTTFFSDVIDDTPECKMSGCKSFVLSVNNTCGAGGGGGGGGGGGIPGLAIASYDSYRINYGLKDSDDDRQADSNAPAVSNQIRLDRFLPGDTMRTALKAVVILGNLSQIDFRIFNESWSSDFGVADGDSYLLAAAKGGLVHYDSLMYIGGTLQFVTAAGQEYTCPASVPTIKSDQHIFTVAAPNVEPPAILDEVASMFDEYSINLMTLANSGCVPANFVLGPGDSLYFTADYKFRQNFVPLSGAIPALVNMRNTACGTDNVFAWMLEGCFSPKLRQYSGYVESISPATYDISPCDTTEVKVPFQYAIRIARGNMFPFEVRPLTVIKEYRQSFPTIVPHIGSRLDFMNLQESTPLFGQTPVVVQPIGGLNRFLLTPFFVNPVDEGYNLQLSSRFGKTCGYNGIASSITEVTVRYPNKCFNDPTEVKYQTSDPDGYSSGSAELELFTQNSILDIPADVFNLDIFVRNNTNNQAPNAWLSLEGNGQLEDVELLLLPSLVPVPLVGGVFQLGEIDAYAQPPFRLRASSKLCENVTLTIRFGWDCDPVTAPGSNPCGNYTETIELRPLRPELELDILAQPAEIPMCEPSDFFEFEVYNANEGLAFGTTPSVKLPPGLSIVPGTSRLSYPAGAAYVNMPDPTELPGFVFQWSPEGVSATLAANGLAGVDDDPNNAMRIRFKVQAVCGFVANSQIIFGAEAIQACGAASNILRKPGEPVQLEGVDPSYETQASLSFSMPPGEVDCAESTELTATITMGDTPNTGDSIYILLPAGITYVTGSYNPSAGAPLGPPQVLGSQLRLPLPGTLGAGTSFVFKFKVQYNDPAGCDDKLIVMQTREQKQVFCPAINQNCSVYIATGEVIVNLKALNPNLRLLNFNTTASSGTSLNFNADLENIGDGLAFNPIVKFYLDTNNNGVIDTGEPLVNTSMPNINIPAGNTTGFSGTLANVTAADLCKLIAFIPAEDNCGCEDQIFPLGGMSSITYSIGRCSVGMVPVGIDEVAGHTYTWLTPNGMSCVNCANGTFTPGINTQTGELVTLILSDQSGDCTVEHIFEIKFGGILGIDLPNQIICKGESVTIEATPGGTYNWTGTGITDPMAQIQNVSPLVTTTYKVTVTFGAGCSGTDQIKVTVLKKDSMTLATLETCEGSPVNILNMLTDVSGTYVQTFTNVNGCDSLVIQTLVVTPNQTEETVVLCPNDSVMVYDSLFTTAGFLTRDLVSSVTGCDSTHRISVVLVPKPELPANDTTAILQGTTHVLDIQDNFANYLWETKDPKISCTDCFDPTAMPDTSQNYTVYIEDGNGCKDTATYRIIVFPPCDPQRLEVPNAFSPNADTENDKFRVVEFEGLETVTSLVIYNRWGNKVWSGGGQNAAWDGTIDGKPAPSDVYVWILTVDCGGEKKERKGDVSIVR